MAETGSFWSNPYVAPALIGGGLNFAGGLIGNMGQAQAAEAASEQNAETTRMQNLLQGRLGLAGNIYGATSDLNQQLATLGYNRDVQGAQLAQANPLQAQQARGQMALFADILPGLRNAQITPPRGLQGYTPTVTGGFRIPEGGFSKEALSFYSPQARANAEGQFYSAAAPFMQPPDLSAVGYGSAGVGPTAGAQGARSSFEAQQARQHAAQLAAIQGYQQSGESALNQYATDSAGAGEKLEERREGKGPGFWRKLLGVALPIAAAFIPGVGPLASVWAQMALQAGAGAAGAALGGGNPLYGAAMGGLTGGLGAKFGPAGMYGNPRAAASAAGAGTSTLARAIVPTAVSQYGPRVSGSNYNSQMTGNNMSPYY